MSSILGILGWIGFAIKWVLIFAIFYAFLHSFVTHFVLWYETRLDFIQNHPHGSMPKLRLFARSFFIEAFCSFIRYLLMPFHALSPQKIAKLPKHSFLSRLYSKFYKASFILEEYEDSNDFGTPILLVHGYTQKQTDWIWFWHQLQRITDGPIYTVNLSPKFGSIEELAKGLENQVDIILNEMDTLTREVKTQWGGGINNPRKKNQVILVGHSMGGLVCSYYAEHFAKPDTVSKIILIASPIHGTKTVPFGIGKNVIEMRPNSPLLADLRHRMKHSEIPYYFVASQLDNMIIPWHSGLLHPDIENSLENHYIIEDTGHSGLLLSPRVVRKIAAWVKET